MMGGRRTAGCAIHGRSDTELTGLVDAGLAGQNPVTLERFPLLAEKLPSVKNGQPAIEVILPALKNTLVLIITVVVIGKIVAVLLGIFSAMRQYSLGDYFLTALTFISLLGDALDPKLRQKYG